LASGVRERNMHLQEERARLTEAQAGRLPIRVEEILEEHVPVAPGGTLFLDLERGSVEVTEQDRDEVYIRAEARGWGAHLVSFQLDRKGDDLELEADIDSWLALLFPGTRTQVHVEVPPDYSVDIRTRAGRVRVEGISGGVTVSTSAGSIRLRRIAGSARLQTTAGSIRVEELEGNLRAQTTSGAIRAADVAGWVEARAETGAVDLVEVDGPVEARTTTGRIRVGFVDEPEGTLETGTGSIEVGFPEDAGTDLDAHTRTGRIRVDHGDSVSRERDQHRLVAQINGGGPPLAVHTSTGSIRLRITGSARFAPRSGARGLRRG
jgi:hypothetical protein